MVHGSLLKIVYVLVQEVGEVIIIELIMLASELVSKKASNARERGESWPKQGGSPAGPNEPSEGFKSLIHEPPHPPLPLEWLS